MACFAIYSASSGAVSRAGECPDRDVDHQAMAGESVMIIDRDAYQQFSIGHALHVADGAAVVLPRPAFPSFTSLPERLEP